jgi:hypothetical protein
VGVVEGVDDSEAERVALVEGVGVSLGVPVLLDVALREVRGEAEELKDPVALAPLLEAVAEPVPEAVGEGDAASTDAEAAALALAEAPPEALELLEGEGMRAGRAVADDVPSEEADPVAEPVEEPVGAAVADERLEVVPVAEEDRAPDAEPEAVPLAVPVAVRLVRVLGEGGALPLALAVGSALAEAEAEAVGITTTAGEPLSHAPSRWDHTTLMAGSRRTDTVRFVRRPGHHVKTPPLHCGVVRGQMTTVLTGAKPLT